MVTLSVCLETVFTDLPVEKRIGKIAETGYGAVEFWHPEGTWDGSQVDFEQAKDPVAIGKACEEHGVMLNDFAMHAWDGSIGGSPVKTEDRQPYLAQIRKMIEFGKGRLLERNHTFRYRRPRAVANQDAVQPRKRSGRGGRNCCSK